MELALCEGQNGPLVAQPTLHGRVFQSNRSGVAGSGRWSGVLGGWPSSWKGFDRKRKVEARVGGCRWSGGFSADGLLTGFATLDSRARLCRLSLRLLSFQSLLLSSLLVLRVSQKGDMVWAVHPTRRPWNDK